MHHTIEGVGGLFIILLMKAQCEQAPFEIVHNARSTRGSRSRKSSISVLEKEKVITKSKKLRKMTMNTETINRAEISEIEQLLEKTAAKSVKEEIGQEIEEELNWCQFLELGQTRVQSAHEAELQKGIWHGIGNQRQLDRDFYCGWKEAEIEWKMLQ